MREMLSHILFTLPAQMGGHAVSVGVALAAAAVLLLLRALLRRRVPADAAGQVRVMMAAQADLARRVDAGLARLDANMRAASTDTTRHTMATLGSLGERLATIDAAQTGIRDLGHRMADLQDVLSDKQRRGAFGEARLEAIVADALPPSMVSFQATLSNGRRPDCLIAMPGRMPPLVIDAKFPLEAWRALHAAASEREAKAARARLRADIARHVGDVAGKYLVPGETQGLVLLFVPSEAVFADLHEHAGEAVEAARRARVAIVSPTLLMLAVQTVQSLVRDARVAEHGAHLAAELRAVADASATLQAAAAKLRADHDKAARDIDTLVAAAETIARRAARADAVEMPRRSAPLRAVR